jgi:hypothetical protein
MMADVRGCFRCAQPHRWRLERGRRLEVRRKTIKMRREFRWGYDFFKNTERNTSKIPNETPQKHRFFCLFKIKILSLRSK